MYGHVQYMLLLLFIVMPLVRVLNVNVNYCVSKIVVAGDAGKKPQNTAESLSFSLCAKPASYF